MKEAYAERSFACVCMYVEYVFDFRHLHNLAPVVLRLLFSGANITSVQGCCSLRVNSASACLMFNEL